MDEVQYVNLDFLQPKNAWEALSQKEKADVMKVAVRRGITDLATIRQMYNEFAEGGEVTPVEYAHQRFPVTQEFDVYSYKDENFTPEGMGNIEYMSAAHDSLPYYNNYQKPDSLRGKATVVYNNRMGDATNEAVALDILSHGLREQDPTWRKKYLPTLHDAFEGDAIYNMTDRDKAVYNLNDPEEKGEVIDNYIDGYIRTMAVDDKYRKALNYASRKEFNREYNQLPPEQQNALAEAYSYIHPTQLPEITVTGNKHSEGGNLFGGGSYMDKAKALIKENEDWKSTPYKDAPKGKTWRSVGYGFNDSGFYDKYPEGISKHYEKGITKAQAEEELNWYLNRADSHLRKMYGSKWDTFTDGQKAAILDTYYQRPASVAKGSVFYGNIMSGKGTMTPGVSGYSERNWKRKKAFLGLDTEPYEVPTALQPAQDNTFVFNPYILQQQATLPYPEVVSTPTTLPTLPSEVELEYQRKQQEAAENRYRFNMAMNVLKLLNGEQDPAESFLQNFMPNPSIPLFEGLPEDQYAHGGKIHIKKSHRGKFTRLKERTGKSASWYKAHGTPEQRKMATFELNARKWKHGLGGNLYGGGGFTNVILGPRPGVTDNEDVRGILSWLPYTSTAIDIDNAAKDPSAANLTWAGISTGLDALSFGLASKIKKGIKAVEKAITPAEKEAAAATKRAERAKKVYDQADNYNNYRRWQKAEREAFEKNYVLNNQVDGLYKQLADEQWYKSTWLPIMDGHGGIVSQGAQTIFEGANTPQKALGGNLFAPGGDITYGAPHYLYDENGQLVRDANGKPVLNYNATLSDITIIPDSQKSPADRNEDERFRARTQKDYDEHKQSEWAAQQANSWKKSYNQSGAKKVEDFFKGEQKDEWKTPTYFSAFDSSLKPYGELFGALAHGLQPLSPSQHVGAAADAIQGKRGYFDSLFNGNSGFFSDQWAAEHPLVSLYGNMVGDAAAGIGAFKGYNAGKQFVQNNYTGAFGKPVVPEGYSAVSPTVRTKVGDVEINNPSLFYRQGPTDMGDDFLQIGIVGAGTEFDNPMFARGKLWYGLGDATKKPVAEVPKREGRILLSKSRIDKPKPDLIVSTADMVPADSHSHPKAEIVTKQRTHPYGERDYATFPQFKDIMDEWNNAYYAGDIPDKVPVTQVNSEYVRVVPREEGSATTANSTLYRYDPNYGYRKVSGFSEDTPAAEWAQAGSIPLMAIGEPDYTSPFKGTSDLFSKLKYQAKVSGKPMTALFPTEELFPTYTSDVVKGLPLEAQDDLMRNTVARQQRVMQEFGVSPESLEEYATKAKDLMDDVRVGRYSGEDYEKAGMSDTGGFYDNDRNFISINEDSGFPQYFVPKHEGRHLLDFKLDRDFYNNNGGWVWGNDFDLDANSVKIKEAMDEQMKIVSEAFDDDFVNLPNTEYAGEKLKNYKSMADERFTTNRDARDKLLGNHSNMPLWAQDKIIDKTPDAKVFEAVEKANGYGRRYIQYLREHNKLTPEKAQKFRKSMKRVGMGITAIGTAEAIANSQALGGPIVQDALAWAAKK